VNDLRVLSAREASIFACYADAVVAPAGVLPPIAQTDAAFSLDANLAAAPVLNRTAIRALLLALEVAPKLLGFGARLRRLDVPRRAQALDRLDELPVFAPALKALRGLAQLSYYGDAGVLGLLGYDPAAVVERGRRLRREEGRW
jgi:hypothetical protein